jgi:hypothetical protein
MVSSFGAAGIGRGGAFAANRGFHGGFDHRGFRGRRFGFGYGLGYGLYDYDYGPYAYDDYYPSYGYDDSYYDNGGCYVVQRRIHTKQGYRVRPVQVCS